MLNTNVSCEIGDLIKEIMSKSNYSWDEVETALFACGKYPESNKTYITTQFGPIVYCESYPWLEGILQQILLELHLDGLYITQSI